MSGRGTTVDRAASYQAESKGEFSVDDCVSSRGFFKQSRERVGAVVIYRHTYINICIHRVMEGSRKV